MQENFTVARPYAQAAFDTALEAGMVGEWGDALQMLGAIVSNADMRRVITDPSVSKARLLELILAVAGNGLPPRFANLIKVLVQAGRLPAVPAIAELFAQRRAARDNIADVQVASAFPLDSELEQRLATAMRARLGCEVRLSQVIDPTLIGGARLKVGDMVFDASLRGGLTQLANVFNLK